MQLREPLISAAKEVVAAYDTFNWDELREDGLDRVFLMFDTLSGLERADGLICHLACEDPAFIQEGLQRCLKQSFQPVRQYASVRIDYLRGKLNEKAIKLTDGAEVKRRLEIISPMNDKLEQLESSFKALLKRLADAGQPCEASQRLSIWEEAVARVDELETVRQEVTSQTKGLGMRTESMPPPPIRRLRVGDFGPDWLSLPLSQFSRALAVFCRKLAQVNTGLTLVTADGCLETYQHLFTSCGLLSLTIPWQDSVPPSTGMYWEKATNRLSKAMGAFLKEVVLLEGADEAAKLAGHGTSTVAPIGEGLVACGVPADKVPETDAKHESAKGSVPAEDPSSVTTQVDF